MTKIACALDISHSEQFGKMRECQISAKLWATWSKYRICAVHGHPWWSKCGWKIYAYCIDWRSSLHSNWRRKYIKKYHKFNLLFKIWDFFPLNDEKQKLKRAVGVIYRRGPNYLKIDLKGNTSPNMYIVVENMARVNFGLSLIDPKVSVLCITKAKIIIYLIICMLIF